MSSCQSPFEFVTTFTSVKPLNEFNVILDGETYYQVVVSALTVSSVEVTVGTLYFLGIIILKVSMVQRKHHRVSKAK